MQVLLKALLLSLLAAGTAMAQPYPSKPIRFIVSFAPAGPADVVGRLVGQKISEAWGQPVVVENVTGSGGNIAAARVAKAPNDGYTVLVHTAAYAVNPAFMPNLGYDIDRDLIPVVVAASQPNFIVVQADFPPKTLAELIAKARVEKLAFASPGSGTTPHLTAENLFRFRAKLDITHIPFKGGSPAAAAVLGGQPPIGTMAGSGPMPHIKSGKLRALAVSSSRRLASLPDVPTLTELGYAGMEDYTWVGLFVPAGTPQEIIQKLNEATQRAVQAPDVRERLDALTFEVTAQSVRETQEYVKSELAKWARVVKDTGTRPD
jgi:tripartite-type tricarboxylate transporter receptor subunit TctC